MAENDKELVILQEIIILGLGPGSPDLITQGALAVMKKAPLVYLRTRKHPVVPYLEKQGIRFTSFDWVYEEGESFTQVYQKICQEVFSLLQKNSPIVYAVPGHPLVGEITVQSLLEQAKKLEIKTTIVPGMSALDALYSVLCVDPAEGIKIIDALSLDKQKPDLEMGNILLQVYNRFVASEVKLSLMDFYPDEHPITVVRAAGITGEEKIVEIPLYELDRLDFLDHLVSVYLPPYPQDREDGWSKLLEIMAALRSPEGCPWDREQDHLSLRQYLLEETYEVLETIETGEMHKLCEELGDLLLQIVFHAQIAEENSQFTIDDVLESINQKMIRRHPHVFADVEVENSDQVLVNWEQIKALEKKEEKKTSVLDGVPPQLPALMLAFKIQQKAAKVGFDWKKAQEAWEKVQEELSEVGVALQSGNKEELGEELGDLLFALVNVCRLLKMQPELLLRGTVEKFKKRFAYIEQEGEKMGKELTQMSLEEMENLWQKAKKQ